MSELDLWKNGVSIKEIAEKHGVCPNTIRYRLSKFSEYENRPRIRQERGRETKVIELYRKGYTPTQIAGGLGITIQSVRRHLLKLEDYRKSSFERRKKTEQSQKKIHRMLDAGIPPAEIAHRLGRYTNQIYRIAAHRKKQKRPPVTRKQPYTREDADKILALYSQGKSFEEIAIELGMGIQTPSIILRRFIDKESFLEYKRKNQERRFRIPQEKRDLIVQLGREGYRGNEIAEIVGGISATSVRKILHKNGISLSPCAGGRPYTVNYSEDSFGAVVFRYLEGMTLREIGRELGISKHAPAYILRKFLDEEELEEYKELHLDARCRKGLNFRMEESCRDEIIRLRQQGLTLKAIAQKTHCSVPTVCSVLSWARTFSPRGESEKE